MPSKTPSVRYSLLDAIRAAAIVNMIAFHLCYNIFCVFGVWEQFYLHPLVMVWEHLICFTFIIVSGMSINFSRRGYMRGIIVNLCGFLITVVTVLFLPEQRIFFGILNLIGCAMLITFTLRQELRRIRPPVGTIVFFLIFMLCYGVPYGYFGIFTYPLLRLPEALYQYRWLAFLGFPDKSFFSADYFPLIPWVFLYLSGFELWRWIEQKKRQRVFLRRIPVLDLIGRHSLLIYMLHQPVLYGICWLIFTIGQ